MLINGEKWACEACVRGHRVSNCQHTDRPLQHINKKGRPVSQCQHCRSMRKSRSAHVKCDCGEKTSKCIHLRTPQEGHRDTCCCNHGGRCTCAHKQEQNQLDTVPESDSDKETSPSQPTKPAARNRRRANTIQSDGALTFDENGHHKPIHKGTKASQKCGPYQLNRVHSVHSTSSLSNRSADSLLHKTGTESRKRGSAASRTAQSKSETASPQMPSSSSSFSQLNPGLPPLDLSSIEYPQYVPNFDLFSNGLTEEPAMFSAGLRSTSSIDWSHYDGLPNFGTSSYGRGNTLGGFDFGSDQAALTNTTSNSGDVSEAEDFMSTGNDEGFRLSTNSSFIGLSQAQTSMLASPDVNLTFDDFLKQSTNKFLHNSTLDDTFTAPAFSLAEDALWASNFADGVATMPESPVESGAAFWDRQ